jgi:cytochrome d ubiquinol oxidase subunit II
MLFEFTTYQVIWWALVGAVLILYAWTSGFDLGIGSLLPFIAHKNDERRVLINVIGPTWDGNQVWLIFGGGAIFAVWPAVYSTIFSGFYVAMLLVLWTLFLRPLGFEYRAKIHNATWQSTWDWALFIGSVVPAIVIGVAFGNLMRGVPIHFDATYRSFYDGSFWQLLNPFSILCGLVSLSMLVTHGANLLLMRTDEVIFQRCLVASRLFSLVFIICFAVAGIWIASGLMGYQLIHLPAHPQAELFHTVVHKVPAGLLHNYTIYPWMIIAPVLGFTGALLSLFATMINKTVVAFIGSMIMIAGTILTFGFSMFPFIAPSITHPNVSLTLWNASTTQYSLAALFWVALFILPTIGLYTLWVYAKMWGIISTKIIKQRDHELY